MKHKISLACAALILALAACAPRAQPSPAAGAPSVLVVESFLADITRNVAGDRLPVEALIPEGVDPHAFEPTPRDIVRIADSSLLIVNGAGLESWLQETLDNAGGSRTVVEAAAGLAGRQRGASEGEPDHGEEIDPHFWLDPLLVVDYVENIRAALSAADPAGAELYAQNVAAYTAQLQALDGEIRAQIDAIPAERRLMVTNHESFGYFADRYGLTITGAIIPSVSTGASPSAQQLARLVDAIRATHARAVFLEAGSDPKLAQQLTAETGIRVVSGLYTHSVTPPDGPAPSYLAMMRENTRLIVSALKE